jgi:hypothetical protein
MHQTFPRKDRGGQELIQAVHELIESRGPPLSRGRPLPMDIMI